MAKMTCPECGHTADASEFQKSDVAKLHDEVGSMFEKIQKADPGLKTAKGLAMASAMHVVERRKRLGF